MAAKVVKREMVTYYARCEECFMNPATIAQTRDLQYSSNTSGGAERMAAEHNERWHREEAGNG